MITNRPLEMTWDIRQRDPALLARLTRNDPGVQQVLDGLSAGCPIASTCRPFETPTYVRMKGHVRSFAAPTSGGGVVVFKGTEPLSNDYLDVFEQAYAARTNMYLSRIEWFLLIENEPFLGQAYGLAHHYATLAHEFIRDYAARFDTLPRVPFPLAVYRLPDADALAYAKNCQPYLSDRPQFSARERLDDLVKKGLGVFVYYYPGTPLRAAHARGVYPGSHEPGALKEGKVDFRAAIDKWLDLVAEMLVVGYVPTGSIHQGNCMQVQNLCVDGGACDIDSLEPMSRIKTDRDFLDALFYSLFMLTWSISFVLTNKRHHVDQVVFAMVWSELCERVARKSKGGPVDPRLALLKPLTLDVLLEPVYLKFLEDMRPHPIGTLMP